MRRVVSLVKVFRGPSRAGQVSLRRGHQARQLPLTETFCSCVLATRWCSTSSSVDVSVQEGAHSLVNDPLRWEAFRSTIGTTIESNIELVTSCTTEYLKTHGPHACATELKSAGLSVRNQQLLLLHMANSFQTWRTHRFFDLLVDLLSSDGELFWSIKETQEFIGALPRIPEVGDTASDPGVLWTPHELGRLVGTILKKEMELDVITSILAGVVIKEWPKRWLSPTSPPTEWYSYMGYAGAMLTDALAINKHWVDEDYQWVVNDFAHDVGLWAVRTWGPETYSKFEHQLFLADVISTLAIKYGRFNHDIRLIQMMLNMLCMNWPDREHEVLAVLIAERMKPKTLQGRLKNWIQLQADVDGVIYDGKLAQSQLWMLPPALANFVEGPAPVSWIKRFQRMLGKLPNSDLPSGLVTPQPEQMSAEQAAAARLSAARDPHEDYRAKINSGKAAALQLQAHQPLLEIESQDKKK